MKEQTADGAPGVQARPSGGLPALALDRPLPAALQRWLVPTLFVALALLVTIGYGSGVQLNDGQVALHVDPLRFLRSLLHAWNPSLALGTHSGFWVPYQMPYSWLYAAAQVLHVPQEVAQHAAVFLVYLGCLWAMYYCLRGVAPWLDEVSLIAGSCAYLFNMYVALNSQAQIVWLLTYGALPAIVGVFARAIRGEMNIWRAALAIALLSLVGGGVNPPLVAINVAIVLIYIVVAIAFDPKPAAALSRTLPIVAAAAIASVAINLYWLVPFVDYFRSVWLNGVLSEAPSMHNAATSFANVLRGLGHWATFVSFAGRAYFPWAAAYAGGLFGALLWFVPIVALGGIAFKRNQRPVTLFFLLVTIVSVPIVVGYYHDALGDAVTTPIYDQFYRSFPGFQMFRFSYKWVAGVEFGICGLFALGCYAMVTALRDHIATLGESERRSWDWLVPTVRGVTIALPILVFVPVLIAKMNYPGPAIPAWEYRENALLGNDRSHRVALFPTQFLEQFDWGSPQFYIEDSLVDRPMVYGLLGSEPSEGSDLWVRRAYRATREGLPFASDMFRVMGVDTLLQRDDFIPAIDFSSPGEWRYNSTTLTHDLIHRVLGASPLRSTGPLRVYHLGGALPLFYAVTHPVLSTLPAFSDALLGDVGAMANGRAEFNAPNRTPDEFAAAVQSLSPILPASLEQQRDLAVNLALAQGIRVHPPSADAAWLTHFNLKSEGVYSIFVLDQSLLFNRPPPQTLIVDGRNSSLESVGGAWTQFSDVVLTPGSHWVSDGYLDPDLVVAIVNAEDLKMWQARIAALVHDSPRNLATADLVYARRTSVVVPASGRYRVRATAVGPYGPDGNFPARVLPGSAYRGAFPASLSGTLPYIFGDGIMTTSTIQMPPQWYRLDPAMYAWERGDPLAWFLFARDSHVRVFVPGGGGVRSRVSLRVSRLQASDQMTVTVNRKTSQSVSLPGPPASATQYDAIDHLDGPVPVSVGFTADLQPGWNDVAFDFHPEEGERADLGTGVISAAVAPDLSFEAIGAAQGAVTRATDSAFNAVALAPPPAGLTGDPELLGSVSRTANRGFSAAVAVSHQGRVDYRLFPIAHDGSFDINVMHAFPNDWDDASENVVGIWLIARGNQPRYSGLYYAVRAMPERALRRPQSLSALPITIDGRSLGSAPMWLARGRHRVASTDRQVKIGLLSLDPVSQPLTRDFSLVWTRHSPTAIDVAAKSTATPFLLVFGEAYHPEWRATLDGNVLPHVIVNGLENGWIVPSLPASDTIALTFVSQQYYLIAGAISVIALIILIVLAAAPDLWPVGTRER